MPPKKKKSKAKTDALPKKEIVIPPDNILPKTGI